MKEAVARFVPDGASVCMGTALEALIPFAAGHELIRQRRRGLTLVGPISDILFDQLVGAGCVARIQAAWVGNVSAGLGYNYRRAVEHGVPHRIEVEDHSNLSMAAALQAGAMGAPYVPTYSLLGTGLVESNPSFKQARDPFSGGPVVLVPALTPDVAILHEPFGAYPSPVQGCYGRGHDFYRRYHEDSRTVEGMQAWLDRWVHGVADWRGFLSRLGTDALDAVRVKAPR